MTGGRLGRPASLLRRLEDGLLVALVGVLLFLSFAQIVLRNLFAATPVWLDPLTRHLVMWTGFLGALVATREDKHIRIDAGLRLLSPPRRAQVLLVGEGVAAATCGWLAWVAVRFVADERTMGVAAFPGVPTWVAQLVFPLCFGLMACRYAVRAARRSLALCRGDLPH
ncbi:MAG: TRAP transporter small permease [Gemmatimonadota bacterium]